MTLPEKARQLSIYDGTSFLTNGKVDSNKLSTYLSSNLGAGKFDSLGRNVDPSIVNIIQQAVVNSSKHNIGVIIAEECQHGVQGDHHTIFPSPYTIAATFDTELLEEIGKVIAAEARAGGISECWSPVCGLAREPRWGRSEEEMGEDPFLAGELASSMVSGMISGGNLTNDHSVAPLLKHYAAYSLPQGGHNAAPTFIGRRQLQEMYLPPFRKAVQAGAQGIMSSYNEIDGVPTSADSWLMIEKLRQDFGFDGYVASDFGAISGLGPSRHSVAVNDTDSVRMFISSGGSMDGHDFGDKYEQYIVALVQNGTMSMKTLDVAVANVLRVKTRLGLVAMKPSDINIDETLVSTRLGDNPKHVALGLRAARESIVLLNNDDNVLPLNIAPLTTIAVIGPNADVVRSGDYSAAGWAGGTPNGGGNINNDNMITIVEGLKTQRKNDGGTKTTVTYAVGTGINGGDANIPYWNAVQRHNLRVKKIFKPNAPSNPYKPNKMIPKYIPRGVNGLKAEYYDNIQLTGNPILTRRDAAINFHWFELGPDPTRLPSGTFSVRWSGILNADSNVQGALMNAMVCRGKNCPSVGGIPGGTSGARVWWNDTLIIDNWGQGKSKIQTNWSSISIPIDINQGEDVSLIVEYFQKSSDGNPCFALQWSLLSTTDGNTNNTNSETSIASAATLASSSSVAVVVLGGANNAFFSTSEGEGTDKASLSLPGYQMNLLKAVVEACKNTNVPVVVILVDGKPTAEPYIKDLPTVVAAFQGGQASGQAIAEVLVGKINPSGKLPVSFPLSSAVLPIWYNHKPSASRGGYCDTNGRSSVLWTFGHGLSYTKFNYSNLVLPTVPILSNGTLNVSCTVTNVGKVDGVAVAQLYVRHVAASVTTPVRMLKGFFRVFVQAGKSKTVTFPGIHVATELRVLGRNYQWRVESGELIVMVGDASDDTSLVGNVRVES